MSEVYDMWTGGKNFDNSKDSNLKNDGYSKNSLPKKKIELDSYVRDELFKVLKDMEIKKEEFEKEEKLDAKDEGVKENKSKKILEDKLQEEIINGVEEKIEKMEEFKDVFEEKEEEVSPERLLAIKINNRIEKRMTQLEKNLNLLTEEDIELLRERILNDIKKSIKEDSTFFETWYLNFKYHFNYGDKSYEELFIKDDNLRIKALVNHKDLVDFAGEKFKKDFKSIKYVQGLRSKFKKGSIEKVEIESLLKKIEKLQVWIATNPLIKIYNYILSYYEDLGRRINYDLYSKEIDISSDLDVEYQRGYLALDDDDRIKYEMKISNMLHEKYMDILRNSKDTEKVQKVQRSIKDELDCYKNHLDEVLSSGLKVNKRKFYEGDLKQAAKFIPLFFIMISYIFEGRRFSSFSIIAVTTILLSNSLWILDGVAKIKEETNTNYNLEWSEVLISLSLFGTGIWTIIDTSIRGGRTEAIMSLSGVLMVIGGILAALFWERVEVERLEEGKLIEDYKYRFHGINFLGHGIKARKRKQIESMMKCEYKDVYCDGYFQCIK